MYKCRCCEAQTNTGRELQSCTKPFSIVFIPALASTDYCPATPKISYSAASQPRPSGLLETHNVYVAEELLNLAESIGTQPFFSQYQAGFTLGVRDPPYSVCSCNATQDCDSITPLVNSDPVSETPHYSVNQLCALATALCQYGGDCSQLDALGTSCSDLGASVAMGLGATSLSCNDSSQLSYTVDGLSADILEVSRILSSEHDVSSSSLIDAMQYSSCGRISSRPSQCSLSYSQRPVAAVFPDQDPEISATVWYSNQVGTAAHGMARAFIMMCAVFPSPTTCPRPLSTPSTTCC